MKKRLVPLAGIEPALLAELDFEFERVYQFRHRGPRTPAGGPLSRSGRNIAGGALGSTRADVIVVCLDRLAAAGYDAVACLSMDCAPENDRDAQRRRRCLTRARFRRSRRASGAGDRGHCRGHAGGGLVLRTGAGYPSLSALPRTALRLLPGDPARPRARLRRLPPGAAAGAAGRALRCCCWPRSPMPGSVAITPASNGSSGRARPIAQARRQSRQRRQPAGAPRHRKR